MHDPRANVSFDPLELTSQSLATALTKLREGSTAKLTQLGELASLLGNQLSEQYAELERLSSDLGQQLDSLRAALSNGTDTQQVQAARIAELETELEARQAQISEAGARADALAGQVNALEAARDEQAARVRELEEELTRVRESVGAETSARLEEAVTEERSRLSSQIESQARELSEVRAALSSLEEELKNTVSNDTVAALRTQYESEQRSLRAMLEDEQAECARLRTVADGLAGTELALRQEKERAHHLEQRLKEETARATKSLLAEQLADALREADTLRDELKRLQGSGGVDAGIATSLAAKRDAEAEEAKILRLAGAFRNGHKRTLGEILTESGVLTQAQLDEALEEQHRRPQTHLGAILIQMGYATSEAVARALALQCNVEYVRLADTHVAADAVRLISARLATQRGCIPLRVEGEDTIVIAIANPLDLVAIEDIERSTGRHVEILVATDKDIRAALEKHYSVSE